MTKTLEELQKETKWEFRDKFHDYDMEDPRNVMVDKNSGSLEAFISSSQQQAYDLAMERVREQVELLDNVTTVVPSLIKRQDVLDIISALTLHNK